MSYEKLTSSSPEAQSESPVADHVNALASLFPSVVREGKVDFDALRQMLGDDVAKDDELFGLQWKGKAQARRAATTPSLGTLRPCKEESVDWDATKNLYLEGDNLEVLKLLRKSYAGKVKMIYIDPPYNTGKDFIYPDNYENGIEEYKKLTGQLGRFKTNAETSGRYHTNWLNMMYPRLMLARDFLKEDGIIFISIDDKESCNSKNLCDEVFGVENFIAQLIWQNKKGGGNDSKHIAIEHEYILAYASNIKLLNEFYESYSEDYRKRYKEVDENGSFFWDTFKRKSGKQYYPIICPDGTVLEYDDDGNPISWLRSKKRFNKDINTGEVRIVKLNEKWSVQFKQRMPLGKTPRSIFTTDTVISDRGTTSAGANDVYGYFKKDVFENPKPVDLISFLFGFGLSQNDYILDFFSGSATTAEAIIRTNVEGGNHKFIMIQLPENIDPMLKSSSVNARRVAKNAISILDGLHRPHLITELAKERIRRAGKKIKEEAGLQGKNLDIGFRVYKLDSSNLRVWNPEVDDLELALGSHEKHLLPGRTQEDLLYEILLKQGIELTEDARIKELGGKRVYSLGHGQYYACMETVISSDQIESLALGIAQWKNEESPDNTQCAIFVIDEAFRSDADKLNFAKILEQHGIPSVKAL